MPFTRQRRQHEHVVGAIQRQQPIERNGPRAARRDRRRQAIARPRAIAAALVLARPAHRRTDDVERDVDAARDAAARPPPAARAGLCADRSGSPSAAGRGRRRTCPCVPFDRAGVDGGGLRLNRSRRPGASACAVSAAPLANVERAIGHALHVPFLERRVGAPQQRASRRDTASTAAAPAGRRPPARTPAGRASRAHAEREHRGRASARGSAADRYSGTNRSSRGSIVGSRDRTARGRRKAAAAPA